jgi:hypothetical protein
MLLAVGVEVAARALEVGRIAHRVLVDVHGVLADGKVLQLHRDGQLLAVLVLLEGRGAGVIAAGVLMGTTSVAVLRHAFLSVGWAG